MSFNWSSKEQKTANQAAAGGQKRARSDAGNKVTVVIGSQWGDEGKGKVVDLLATEADVICRCQVDIWSFLCQGFSHIGQRVHLKILIMIRHATGFGP